jgi:hypothetical protein
MGGHGHRNMYYLTGLPGWMRFGFSPGWIGRSSTGLGPAAQYLMKGTWPTPQMQSAWQNGQIPSAKSYPGFPMPGYPTPYDPWGVTKVTEEQELNFLKSQAKSLEEQLNQINVRIKELEKE